MKRFKWCYGLEAMILRRKGGAFKERDGLIEKKPTVTWVESECGMK